MKQEQHASRPKRLIGLLALAAALGVVFVLDRANPSATESAPRTRRLVTTHLSASDATAPAAADTAAALDSRAAPSRSAPRLEAEIAFNPFGALGAVAVASASVAAVTPQKPASAPPPVAVAAPIAPTAPPLPFVAVGLIAGADVAGGQPVAFLQQQEQVLLVKVGDDIAKTYRVESISPQRIEFTFLPLQQRQVLTVPLPQ
jgi:hypothetical protein